MYVRRCLSVHVYSRVHGNCRVFLRLKYIINTYYTSGAKNPNPPSNLGHNERPHSWRRTRPLQLSWSVGRKLKQSIAERRSEVRPKYVHLRARHEIRVAVLSITCIFQSHKNTLSISITTAAEGIFLIPFARSLPFIYVWLFFNKSFLTLFHNFRPHYHSNLCVFLFPLFFLFFLFTSLFFFLFFFNFFNFIVNFFLFSFFFFSTSCFYSTSSFQLLPLLPSSSLFWPANAGRNAAYVGQSNFHVILAELMANQEDRMAMYIRTRVSRDT